MGECRHVRGDFLSDFRPGPLFLQPGGTMEQALPIEELPLLLAKVWAEVKMLNGQLPGRVAHV